MPTNACQWLYECEHCQALLRPKQGDCCVFCSYGSVQCPPVQASLRSQKETMGHPNSRAADRFSIRSRAYEGEKSLLREDAVERLGLVGEMKNDLRVWAFHAGILARLHLLDTSSQGASGPIWGASFYGSDYGLMTLSMTAPDG